MGTPKVFSKTTNNSIRDLYLAARNIYGSSRVGVENVNQVIASDNSNNVTLSNNSTNIYTQKIGDKHYELSNHLGNVLEVVTDKKLAIDAGSDGTTDYYVANVISMNNYYPYGMILPNASATVDYGSQIEGESYRYGFNGMEKDDEVTNQEGTSYDFGARFYNPRIGRWLSRDPLESKYPDLTPYNYVVNTPTVCVDPDGKYTIFINGEVGGNDEERADDSYWSCKFIETVNKAFGDGHTETNDFYDGDVGITAGIRRKKGYAAAKADFKTIIANLEKDENGKIIEPVKIVSHSKGAAYAAGFQEAWNELANSEKYKDLFAGDGGEIQVSIMLAPHQGTSFEVKESETVTVAIRHQWDELAWSGVDGDVLNIESDNKQWSWEAWETHTIDGFHFEAKRAIMKVVENLNSNSQDSTEGVEEAVNKASKYIYDRKSDKYVQDK